VQSDDRTGKRSDFSRTPFPDARAILSRIVSLTDALMRVMELHSAVRMVQRSKGRSSTAAAAYRSASRIVDFRTGEIHDYTRKRGVEHSVLLCPDDAPSWAFDRARLWNEAEAREKHPRAQTAREVEIAFPSEFSPEQRREAGAAIGKMMVERYGIAADLSWHAPSSKGDERNHHLHMLMTTRRLEGGEWAKSKDRTLDDLFGKGAEHVTELRRSVADALNTIAARDGLDVYVEHLSYEKRGIDKEAAQHLGPSATEMERRGERTDIGDKNREIAESNAQRQELEAERKVVAREIEREQNQNPAQSRENEKSDPYQEFYQAAQNRRLDLLKNFEQRYGNREEETQRELTALFNSLSQAKGLTGLWRSVTGRTRREEDAARRLQEELAAIQTQKRQALESFERDRQTRMEALKQAQHESRYRPAAEILQAHETRTPPHSPSRAEFERGSEPPSPTNEREAERERIAGAIRERQARRRERGRSGPEQ
jgi:hypothetical protein